MKRALKISALFALLITVVLTVLMTWLARSESGSRWLLQQSLGLAPVTIEASGITGTLADELNIENLSIALPLAKVHAAEIVLNWSPGNLLAGVVAIDSIHIAELSVDVLDTENSDATSDEPTDDPVDDELFWLDFPVQINIESGQLDKLRIEDAEFDKLDLAGTIGHGRLQIETLKTQVYGINLQVSGRLIGPDPGQLEATASWKIPAENLSGSGSFSGNIEKLGFTHVIKKPEAINFNGTIHDLFTEPSLAGVADWSSLRLPGQTVLYSNQGSFTVNSDFRSTRLKGNNTVLFEDWPEAPMQLEALVDLQGITIDTYSMETLDGQVTGSGQI
ncbi:MAG: hypothetical protein GQ549_03835, partial [Gammaproteobacteria bacterium]|nr:hypothetical protein [Gammaproteobacteria bacterium]